MPKEKNEQLIEVVNITSPDINSVLGRYFSEPPIRVDLVYSNVRVDCKLNDFSVIETDYNFGPQAAYYASLETNPNQTKLCFWG